MNLMLLAVFASIALGLFGRRFADREMQLVVVIAIALTVVYFLRPVYMT